MYGEGDSQCFREEFCCALSGSTKWNKASSDVITALRNRYLRSQNFVAVTPVFLSYTPTQANSISSLFVKCPKYIQSGMSNSSTTCLKVTWRSFRFIILIGRIRLFMSSGCFCPLSTFTKSIKTVMNIAVYKTGLPLDTENLHLS